MYKHKLILFFLLFPSLLWSKSSKFEKSDSSIDYIESNYYQYIALADLAYLQKDYQTAYRYYHKAEKAAPLLNRAPYYENKRYIELLLKKGKYEKAEHYLSKLIQDGYPLDYFQHDESFWSLVKQDKGMLVRLGKLTSQIIPDSIYISKIKDLEQIHKSYQKLNSDKLNKEELLKLDSLSNEMEVHFLRIIDDFDFPTLANIGWENLYFLQRELSTIMAHIAKPHLLYYRMLTSIREGKCDPYLLGILVDAYCLQRTHRGNFFEKFIYGVYINVEEKQLYDPKGLDKRRKEIGLPPFDIQQKCHVLLLGE